MWRRGAWALAAAAAGSLRAGSHGLGVGTARPGPGNRLLLQTCRNYVRPVQKKKPVIPSHLDDLPPTMLKMQYAKLPVMNKVDDVVKRLLSVEMASQTEKLKIKKEQLANKVRKDPYDNGSVQVQVAYLTAKIRTFKEHMEMHHKDVINRRRMLLAIDRRNKLLKLLRKTRYDVFEHTCKQLDIEYVPMPQYRRKPSRRALLKKAFCLKIFQETQRLKRSEALKQRLELQKRERSSQEQSPAKGTEV